VVLLIYDIYPELLSAKYFISEKHFLYRFLYSLTQRIYKKVNQIICIGITMAEYILSQNKQLKHKIIIIPNWNAINFNTIENKINKYRKQRGAEGKIHVVYSGNLGATHDFMTILETAKKLQNHKEFVFSIIGDGYQTEKIKRFIKENQLKNIIWETFKPAEKIADVFLSADVFLVTLGPGVEKSSIPSKTYDALAAGSALMVVSPDGSELEKLVSIGKAGKCFEPGNVEGVVRWLKELEEEPGKLNQYKLAAQQLSMNYSPANAKKYVEVLTSL